MTGAERGRASSPRSDAHSHTSEGVEHLRNAAKEMIAAARSFLDAAEELVDDPDTAGEVLDLLGGLAGRASSRLAPDPADARAADAEDGPSSGRVQRINVS